METTILPAIRAKLCRALTAFAAIFVVTGLSASPAQAQSDETAEARVAVIQPLAITALDDMNFGDIFGATGGTVIIDPTIPSVCTATGGLIQTGPCQAATFGGVGQAGQRVRVRRPIGNTITLTGPGADMTITDIVINGDPALNFTRSNPNFNRFTIAASDGSFIFRVGGTLNVNPNQTPGLYTGTFDIQLDYQ